MIPRQAENKLLQLSHSFKSVAVTGPRQSGKTTLVRKVFEKKPYVSLENPDTRLLALDDPRAFLDQYTKSGAVLDEIQRAPQIFSYLQEILDNSKEHGLFILTGSDNFLLHQNISQSLAGRIAFLNLLPLSISELKESGKLPEEDDDLMFRGFYPALYDNLKLLPQDWTNNYLRTYIERDVRQIQNVSDLLVFERFIRILAGRTGQELNYSAIANEVGVDTKTIQSWISILANSFIVFLLAPFYKNFNKTVVKRPKLYFYDTALVCSLLGLSNKDMLYSYPLRGAIFETMVVSELHKQSFNKGLKPDRIFFWRDKNKNEVDLILDSITTQLPVEIKSGRTYHPEMAKSLNYFHTLAQIDKSYLIYGGEIEVRKEEGVSVLNWRNFVQENMMEREGR